MKYVRVELLSCVIILIVFLFFLMFLLESWAMETKLLVRRPGSCMLLYQGLFSYLAQDEQFYIQTILSRNILVARSSTKILEILKSIMHAHVCDYVVCQALFIYIPTNMFLSWMFALNKKLRRILVLEIYNLWLSWFMPNK